MYGALEQPEQRRGAESERTDGEVSYRRYDDVFDEGSLFRRTGEMVHNCKQRRDAQRRRLSPEKIDVELRGGRDNLSETTSKQESRREPALA